MGSLNNSTKSTPASRSWGGFFYDVAVSTGNFMWEHPYTTALIVGGVAAAGVGAYPYFFGSATAAAAVLPNPTVAATVAKAVTTAKAATAAKAVTTATTVTAVKVATTATTATAVKAAVATAATAATVATVATVAKAATTATTATANRPDLTLQQIYGSFQGITLPHEVTDLFVDIHVPPAVTQELCPNSPQLGAILVVTMALMSSIAADITNTTNRAEILADLAALFQLMDASHTFRQLSSDDQVLVMECALRTFYSCLSDDLDLVACPLPRLSGYFARAALDNLQEDLVINMQPKCSDALQDIMSGVDRADSLINFFRKFRG